MSTLTTQFCYGVMVEKYFELPWDKPECNNGRYEGFEDWWIYKVHSFIEETKVFDETGNLFLTNGKEPAKAKIKKFYLELETFKSKIPKSPIEVIYFGYDVEPHYILSIPQSIIETYDYSFLTYEQIKNKVETKDNLKYNLLSDDGILLNFCNEHKIKYMGKPDWYLTSSYSE